jgi:hypothetical protein
MSDRIANKWQVGNRYKKGDTSAVSPSTLGHFAYRGVLLDSSPKEPPSWRSRVCIIPFPGFVAGIEISTHYSFK